MKTTVTPRLFAALFLLAVLGTSAPAGTINNTFDTPVNYVANGIIGDPNWDGVYLRFGDVPGGVGNGNTIVANTTFFPGFLNLENAGGDWSGADNDGFFLYKVVEGDFDVSVQNVPGTLTGGIGFDNRAFHFAGLMVRAYHTNNSGAPFSTTVTNAAENSLRLWRFNEFGFDGQIRQSTNGANVENTYPTPGDAFFNSDTNTTRFFRITRTGNTFAFYLKTNAWDDWSLIRNASAGGAYVPANGTATRPDWDGMAVQVGIAQAPFNTAARDAIFDDFQLSGPNVNQPVLPTAAPSGIVFTPVNSNSVTINWSTSGGDGSLVLVRANGPIISQPVQGRTYNADTNFQSASSGLGAGNTRVVHAGPGTSVTVSGLGGSNNTYTVAVFTYTGSGASTLYNTASPATNSTIGPGRVASVSFTVSPTSIPVGGVARATVIATYDSGDSYDVSAATSTVWSSSDASKIVAINGTLTGIDVGSALVSATYAGVLGSETVSTHAPAFTDAFDSNHDYVARGAAGSKWDGVYLGGGDVPLQVSGNYGPQQGQTMICDANVTDTNMLTVVHRQTGWEGNESDGFFLYKKVQSDFQVAVHIHSFSNAAWQFPGLMARHATAAGGPVGTTGTGFPNGRENHVRWMRFDQGGIGASARRNQNGGNQVYDVLDGDSTAYWLLMVRRGTTFDFYKRVNATDPWVAVPAATRTLASATNGAVLEVGVQSSTFDCGAATNRTVRFESFMLDAIGMNIAPPIVAGPSNVTFVANPANGWMNISWTPAPGSDGTLVVMRAAKPVNRQPLAGVAYVGNANFGSGSNLGSSNYVVYAGSGSSVTVSNLLPGTTYYSAAYSYTGAVETISYNVLNPRLGNALALGAVASIELSLPAGNEIPKGGVALPKVIARYSTGTALDASADAQYSWGPVDALAAVNGVLTGISNTPVTIQAVYGEKTNTVAALVRNPSYTDNFGINRDYLVSGVGGIWNGVYFGAAAMHPANSIPGGSSGAAGDGFTSICDANITSNNVLTVNTTSGDWEFDGDDGFFLFKYVPGDFQVAVHLQSFEAVQNHNAGVMARAYSAGGAPVSTNGESWVSWSRFDSWGIQTDGRSTLDDATTRMEIRDGNTNMWLLLVRQGETFSFFERASEADPWLHRTGLDTARPDLVGRPLQVGLQAAMFAATAGMVQFDKFMLDAQRPTLGIAKSGNNVVLTWVGGGTLQSAGSLSAATWPPVGGVITTDGTNSVSLPAGGTSTFFRLAY